MSQPVAGTLILLAYFGAIAWAIFWGESGADDPSQADRK